jgi:hypothetical protein
LSLRSLLRRYGSVFVLALALLAGWAFWRARALDALLRTLRIGSEAGGAAAKLVGLRRGLTEVTAERAELELEPGVRVEAAGVRIVRPLFSKPSVSVDAARVTLGGAPMVAWERWARASAWSEAPVSIRRLTVRHEDGGLPAIDFSDVVRTPQAGAELLQSARLTIGQKSWSDVAFAMRRRGAVLEFTLGKAPPPEQRVTIKHVMSDGAASEWMLNVPYQPVVPLLAPLGVAPSTASGGAKATGVVSIIVPEAAERRPFGNLRVVVDDWPQPSWPEVSSLVGRSGSFGVSLLYRGDGRTWTLPRIEVSTGLFTLSGTGSMTWSEPLELAAELRGSRSCDELGTHLPSSSYRDRVRAYVAQRPASRGSERAELALSLSMNAGADGKLTMVFRLAPGCGLNELVGASAF